jgi:tripartite-type tricarboxylate transporter receptor subunit TctC
MSMFKTLGTLAAGVALSVAAGTAVLAQNYPSRPIEVICGYVPGGGADIIVRFIAAKLEEKAGQPVVVQNKVGAFGNVATGALVNAKNDGYTMLLTGTSSVIGNLFVLKDAVYDPQKDLTPIATLLRNGFVLSVGPDSPANSVEELMAIVKEKCADARYGQSSVNSLAASELFLSLTGLTAERINYQSSTDMVPDLKANDLDFGMIDAVFALNQHRQGNIKLLAGTPETQVPGSDNLPTMQTAGVAGYQFAANWGSWFPKDTPEDVTRQMHGWLTEIMSSDETKEFLLKNGAEPLVSEFGGAAELVASDLEKWTRIAEAAKLEKQ